MKNVLFTLLIGVMPLFLLSQTFLSDVTISPDSLFFDTEYVLPTNLINNSNQPINILSVQKQCSGCIGWTWRVDSMSFSTPHYIYPGQSELIRIFVMGSVFNSPETDYLHSTMAIGSSVGTQYCHIFINQDYLTSVEDKNGKSIKLYPNPTNSELSIELCAKMDHIKTIKIYNFLGQLVFNNELIDNNITINVASYPSGIYLAKISTINGNYAEPFIKK